MCDVSCLEIVFPAIEKKAKSIPACCPAGCGGRSFRFVQESDRTIIDIEEVDVTIYRYCCTRCNYIFRVYPNGVDQSQYSRRLVGLAAMLHFLGMSHGKIAAFLGAFSIYISKSQLFMKVNNFYDENDFTRRNQISEKLIADFKLPMMGERSPYIKVRGEWYQAYLLLNKYHELVLLIPRLEKQEVISYLNGTVPSFGASLKEVNSCIESEGLYDVDVLNIANESGC